MCFRPSVNRRFYSPTLHVHDSDLAFAPGIFLVLAPGIRMDNNEAAVWTPRWGNGINMPKKHSYLGELNRIRRPQSAANERAEDDRYSDASEPDHSGTVQLPEHPSHFSLRSGQLANRRQATRRTHYVRARPGLQEAIGIPRSGL